MNAWTFALRSLARQPARAVLAALGIAAVGALLFDMLLLSRGLLVSFRDLLDATGFDVRVLATDSPFGGPPVTNASAAAAAIARVPGVEDVARVRMGRGTAKGPAGPVVVGLLGIDFGRRRPWRLLEGHDLGAPSPDSLPPLVVNRSLAKALRLAPGSELPLRADCSREPIAAPPVRFRVAGIVEFPFESTTGSEAATSIAALARACAAERADEAQMLLVASSAAVGPEAVVNGIRGIRRDLHAFSNAGMIAQFEGLGFSYFRQISTALGGVTLVFGFLLITVLLTVSVNQRFAELAALRAIGFSRARLAADVFCQSALLVGAGGVLAVPLGLGLAQWLDRILRSMPGIPASVCFFSFEPRALAVHAGLLAVTAALAALYPAMLVVRLPIAATLRSEAVT